MKMKSRNAKFFECPTCKAKQAKLISDTKALDFKFIVPWVIPDKSKHMITIIR